MLRIKNPSLIFSFTKATSENINIVQEGSTLQLAVNREAGAFGDVQVTWRLTLNAGIVNASTQISPMNGSLTFKQVDICRQFQWLLLELELIFSNLMIIFSSLSAVFVTLDLHV